MGSSSQQFCLKWNNHHSNMLNVFEHLLSSEALVDVTLACEGHSLKAHKMVLSACSPFFQSLFLENPCKHPIVILKDMRYADLKAIIDFMYRGEVNVSQNQLSALLKTAETLKVKGLAEVSGEDGQSNGSGVVQQEVVQQTVPQATAPPTGGSATQGGGGGGTTTPSSGARAETPPLSRRKRGRPRRRSLSDSNRSDSEDQVPAKIREAESPEVIEDRDMDTSSSTAGAAEGPNGVQKLPLPLQTQTQTQSQESRLAIDEATSGDEGDFLPSKLMEQSMTTENVPVFPESQGTGSTRSPTPSQRLMIGSSSLVERSMQGQGPSTSDSQALVPVSQSSEVSGTGHSSQDIPEDIKPTGLVSYDEPSLSPVAGPSHHSQDGSAMMMYMDSSGVPAIPGPSNYQPDKQSSSQTQPSQGVEPGNNEVANVEEFLQKYTSYLQQIRHPAALALLPSMENVCPICLKTYSTKHSVKRHLLMHKPFSRRFQCYICQKLFNWPGNLKTHIQTVHRLLPSRRDRVIAPKSGTSRGSAPSPNGSGNGGKLPPGYRGNPSPNNSSKEDM